MTSDARQPDSQLDEILYCLIENMTVAVSGERLARELGISHSRVVRHVERLRACGVEILGEPFAGFRLTRLPDVLIPQLIADRVHTGAIGQSLCHLYEVDSTNAHALELLVGGRAPHGTVVVSESQTGGKGRRGRSWFSEPGTGLYMSLVLMPDIACTLAPLLTLAAAVAAHETLERVTGIDVDVKWPNDLLIGRKKVGGVLSELQAELDQVRSMVIGIGINVNQESFPQEIVEIATSLRCESNSKYSRMEILLDFLATFERLYRRFLEHGPNEIISPWTTASSFARGRALVVHDGVRKIQGTTTGLNPLGALRILQIDGSIEEVYSGDVLDW